MIILAPVICLAVIKVSKDRLQASYLVIFAFITLSFLDSTFSEPTHTHNPLGGMTGSFLMLVTTGPIILVALSFKKQTKKKKNEES